MGLLKDEIILAKIEAAYGTDSAPTADDAVAVENIGWSHEGARAVERSIVRTSIAALPQLFGGTLMAMTFDVEIKGSGTAGEAPEFDALLRACGLAATVSAGVSVVYEPASDNHESCTIHYFEAGKKFAMTGCRGTVSANVEVGAIAKLSFTLTGHVATPVDSPNPAASYDAVVPPVMVGAAFAVGGLAETISALSFDLGNEIVTPANLNASDGYDEIRLVRRDVTGSFDPLSKLVAVNDVIGDWRDMADKALTTGVLGTVAGNQFKVDMPKIRYREISPGDRERLRTYQIGFGAGENLGDDEIVLTFT